MLPGGSAPEVEVSQRLMEYSRTLGGVDEACVAQFAEALEVIPTTLAENAGLHPIGVLTDLRIRHKKGDKYAGINVRRGEVADMLEANVIQPLLVTLSSFTLATETVRAILKIDDLYVDRHRRRAPPLALANPSPPCPLPRSPGLASDNLEIARSRPRKDKPARTIILDLLNVVARHGEIARSCWWQKPKTKTRQR